MPPWWDWLGWFSKKRKRETNAMEDLSEVMEDLSENLQGLEILGKSFEDKASQQFEKAKEFTRAKNKPAAKQSLKRKKQFEGPIEQLQNLQLQLYGQMIMLEGAKATTEAMDALRAGADAMKAMQKGKNIDDMNNIMDGIKEDCEDTKQMQEAVAGPSHAAADFDEDELEAELKELEEADPVPQRTAEEDKLAASQAEMAL